MSIAALFTIGKKRNCSSTNKWIKKMLYIYTHTIEYYSVIKMNEIVPFAKTWMDLETLSQSEVSQKEKNKYHILTCMYGI